MTVARPAKLSEIGSAIDVILDPSTSLDDKGAAYAVLHQVQLRINRIIRNVAPQLVEYVRAQPGRQLGPISVQGRSVGAKWPCNDPENWGDEIVQSALRELARRSDVARYVRHVPDHYEVDTTAIAAGYVEGDPALPGLMRELNAKHFRTAESVSYSLKVREA